MVKSVALVWVMNILGLFSSLIRLGMYEFVSVFGCRFKMMLDVVLGKFSLVTMSGMSNVGLIYNSLINKVFSGGVFGGFIKNVFNGYVNRYFSTNQSDNSNDSDSKGSKESKDNKNEVNNSVKEDVKEMSGIESDTTKVSKSGTKVKKSTKVKVKDESKDDSKLSFKDDSKLSSKVDSKDKPKDESETSSNDESKTKSKVGVKSKVTKSKVNKESKVSKVDNVDVKSDSVIVIGDSDVIDGVKSNGNEITDGDNVTKVAKGSKSGSKSKVDGKVKTKKATKTSKTPVDESANGVINSSDVDSKELSDKGTKLKAKFQERVKPKVKKKSKLKSKEDVVGDSSDEVNPKDSEAKVKKIKKVKKYKIVDGVKVKIKVKKIKGKTGSKVSSKVKSKKKSKSIGSKEVKLTKLQQMITLHQLKTKINPVTREKARIKAKAKSPFLFPMGFSQIRVPGFIKLGKGMYVDPTFNHPRRSVKMWSPLRGRRIDTKIERVFPLKRMTRKKLVAFDNTQRYVADYQPNKEILAIDHLRRLGYDDFNPYLGGRLAAELLIDLFNIKKYMKEDRHFNFAKYYGKVKGILSWAMRKRAKFAPLLNQAHLGELKLKQLKAKVINPSVQVVSARSIEQLNADKARFFSNAMFDVLKVFSMLPGRPEFVFSGHNPNVLGLDIAYPPVFYTNTKIKYGPTVVVSTGFLFKDVLWTKNSKGMDKPVAAVYMNLAYYEGCQEVNGPVFDFYRGCNNRIYFSDGPSLYFVFKEVTRLVPVGALMGITHEDYYNYYKVPVHNILDRMVDTYQLVDVEGDAKNSKGAIVKRRRLSFSDKLYPFMPGYINPSNRLHVLTYVNMVMVKPLYAMLRRKMYNNIKYGDSLFHFDITKKVVKNGNVNNVNNVNNVVNNDVNNSNVQTNSNVKVESNVNGGVKTNANVKVESNVGVVSNVHNVHNVNNVTNDVNSSNKNIVMGSDHTMNRVGDSGHNNYQNKVFYLDHQTNMMTGKINLTPRINTSMPAEVKKVSMDSLYKPSVTDRSKLVVFYFRHRYVYKWMVDKATGDDYYNRLDMKEALEKAIGVEEGFISKSSGIIMGQTEFVLAHYYTGKELHRVKYRELIESNFISASPKLDWGSIYFGNNSGHGYLFLYNLMGHEVGYEMGEIVADFVNKGYNGSFADNAKEILKKIDDDKHETFESKIVRVRHGIPAKVAYSWPLEYYYYKKGVRKYPYVAGPYDYLYEDKVKELGLVTDADMNEGPTVVNSEKDVNNVGINNVNIGNNVNSDMGSDMGDVNVDHIDNINNIVDESDAESAVNEVIAAALFENNKDIEDAEVLDKSGDVKTDVIEGSTEKDSIEDSDNDDDNDDYDDEDDDDNVPTKVVMKSSKESKPVVIKLNNYKGQSYNPASGGLVERVVRPISELNYASNEHQDVIGSIMSSMGSRVGSHVSHKVKVKAVVDDNGMIDSLKYSNVVSGSSMNRPVNFDSMTGLISSLTHPQDYFIVRLRAILMELSENLNEFMAEQQANFSSKYKKVMAEDGSKKMYYKSVNDSKDEELPPQQPLPTKSRFYVPKDIKDAFKAAGVSMEGYSDRFNTGRPMVRKMPKPVDLATEFKYAHSFWKWDYKYKKEFPGPDSVNEAELLNDFLINNAYPNKPRRGALFIGALSPKTKDMMQDDLKWVPPRLITHTKFFRTEFNPKRKVCFGRTRYVSKRVHNMERYKYDQAACMALVRGDDGMMYRLMVKPLALSGNAALLWGSVTDDYSWSRDRKGNCVYKDEPHATSDWWIAGKIVSVQASYKMEPETGVVLDVGRNVNAMVNEVVTRLMMLFYAEDYFVRLDGSWKGMAVFMVQGSSLLYAANGTPLCWGKSGTLIRAYGAPNLFKIIMSILASVPNKDMLAIPNVMSLLRDVKYVKPTSNGYNKPVYRDTFMAKAIKSAEYEAKKVVFDPSKMTDEQLKQYGQLRYMRIRGKDQAGYQDQVKKATKDVLHLVGPLAVTPLELDFRYGKDVVQMAEMIDTVKGYRLVDVEGIVDGSGATRSQFTKYNESIGVNSGFIYDTPTGGPNWLDGCVWPPGSITCDESEKTPVDRSIVFPPAPSKAEGAKGINSVLNFVHDPEFAKADDEVEAKRKVDADWNIKSNMKFVDLIDDDLVDSDESGWGSHIKRLEMECRKHNEQLRSRNWSKDIKGY